MQSTAKAHIALFLIASIYGLNYIVAKEVMGGGYLQPLTFILFRVITGTILFWLVERMFIRQGIDRKDIGYLALCGLFGVAINQMFFFSGLKLTGPINAALIMTITPIIVFLGAWWILHERLTWRKMAGVGLGLSGAVWLLLSNADSGIRAGNLGDLFIFLNACSYAIYLVLVKKMLKKYHPINVIKWVFTFGMIVVIPFGLWQLPETRFEDFTTGIWLAFLYVLFFTTFLVYGLNVYALRIVSPTVVGMYVYLQPILAAIAAISFGKDQLTAPQILAGMLIFLGIYLVSVAGKSKDQLQKGSYNEFF